MPAEVSLSTYIHPTIKPGTPNLDAPWLILLFIPAAFSFVCPTEVLAFQNCLDEFKDRNCSVVFVSVDTKHSLWHWQNVPRQYGGLGQIDIPLLSDANHRLSSDYGVLIEDEGVSLRGMFILDGEGIVQQVSQTFTFPLCLPSPLRNSVLETDNAQVTLNNLTVGRSVLEALRLLEAFQAVAKHGVLCPIDWKPNKENSETLNTISNTLTESYEERLANLQKEFGEVPVTDLDAKRKSDDGHGEPITNGNIKSSNVAPKEDSPKPTVRPLRSHSSPQRPTIQQVSCSRPKQSSPLQNQRNDCLPHVLSTPPMLSDTPSSYHSASAPESANITPTSTPTKHNPTPTTARHTRGTYPQHLDPHYMNALFSQSAPSIFHSMIRRISPTSPSHSSTDSSSGHSTAPPTPTLQSRTKSSQSIPPRLAMQNTYESRRGSHVVLEFADPTASPPHGPSTPATRPSSARQMLTRTTSWNGPSPGRVDGWANKSPEVGKGSGHLSPPTPASQTRLQATFEAIKKMSSGLASPRKSEGGKSAMGGEDGGYFDVAVEGAEA